MSQSLFPFTRTPFSWDEKKALDHSESERTDDNVIGSCIESEMTVHYFKRPNATYTLHFLLKEEKRRVVL